MAKTPCVELTGDAHIVFISIVSLLGPLESVPDELMPLARGTGGTGAKPGAIGDGSEQSENAQAFAREVGQCTPCWIPQERPLGEILAGQSVPRPRSTMRDLVASWALDREGLSECHRRIRDALPPEALPPGIAFSVESASAMLFSSGTLSFDVTLAVPGGWTHHRRALLAAFGPRSRQEHLGCSAIEAALIGRTGVVPNGAQDDGPLADLAKCIHEQVSPGQSLPDLRDISPRYYHVLYAGQRSVDCPARATLHPEFRSLIYPPGPDPVRSHSPYLDEFAFAGNAFSIYAHEGRCPAGLAGFAKIIQICELQYNRLARICDSLHDMLAAEKGANMTELARMERLMQASFSELTAPTFSFNHRILCLRNGLLRQWGVDDLWARTQALVGGVRARQSESRRRLEFAIVCIGGLFTLIGLAQVALGVIFWLCGFRL